MSIRPGQAKGPWVGTTAGGGGSSFDRDNMEEGVGIILENKSTDDIEIQHGISGLHDNFTFEKPYWLDQEIITSGDWEIDTANGYLEGIAENNTEDAFRRNIEGDFDYAMKMELNAATSCGIDIVGNSITAQIRMVNSGNVLWGRVTGESNQDTTFTGDPIWIRIRRRGTTITMFWKENDADSWTQYAEFTGVDLRDAVEAQLNSGTGVFIHEVFLYDNMFPTKTYVYTLTDAATIAVDASRSDMFEVTLGGNRALGAPTNPRGNGQMILIRVRQDGTGSRTLTYNAIYRFSTDLPSPTLTTAAGDVDYLLFCYDETDNNWDFVGKVFGFAS